MSKFQIDKKLQRHVSEYFVEIVRKKTKPVYYELLRGHASAAPTNLSSFIKKYLKGEELLYFFKRRSNYFDVNYHNEVSLKDNKPQKDSDSANEEKNTNSAEASNAMRKKKKRKIKNKICEQWKPPTKVRRTCINCGKIFSHSPDIRQRCCCFDDRDKPVSSSSSSDVDEDDLSQRVLDYFMQMVKSSEPLLYRDVRFESLPKNVKKYLKQKYPRDKVHRYFLDHYQYFSINDDFVESVEIGSSCRPEDVLEDSEDENNISYEEIEYDVHAPKNKQNYKKKRKTKAPKAAVNISNVTDSDNCCLVKATKFFVKILERKHGKYLLLQQLQGHLSQADLEVKYFLKTNYRDAQFKKFFTYQPKIFKVSGVSVSLTDNYSEFLDSDAEIIDDQLMTVEEVSKHDTSGVGDFIDNVPSTVNLRPFNISLPLSNNLVYTRESAEVKSLSAVNANENHVDIPFGDCLTYDSENGAAVSKTMFANVKMSESPKELYSHVSKNNEIMEINIASKYIRKNEELENSSKITSTKLHASSEGKKVPKTDIMKEKLPVFMEAEDVEYKILSGENKSVEIKNVPNISDNHPPKDSPSKEHPVMQTTMSMSSKIYNNKILPLFHVQPKINPIQEIKYSSTFRETLSRKSIIDISSPPKISYCKSGKASSLDLHKPMKPVQKSAVVQPLAVVSSSDSKSNDDMNLSTFSNQDGKVIQKENSSNEDVVYIIKTPTKSMNTKMGKIYKQSCSNVTTSNSSLPMHKEANDQELDNMHSTSFDTFHLQKANKDGANLSSKDDAKFSGVQNCLVASTKLTSSNASAHRDNYTEEATTMFPKPAVNERFCSLSKILQETKDTEVIPADTKRLAIKKPQNCHTQEYQVKEMPYNCLIPLKNEITTNGNEDTDLKDSTRNLEISSTSNSDSNFESPEKKSHSCLKNCCGFGFLCFRCLGCKLRKLLDSKTSSKSKATSKKMNVASYVVSSLPARETLESNIDFIRIISDEIKTLKNDIEIKGIFDIFYDAHELTPEEKAKVGCFVWTMELFCMEYLESFELDHGENAVAYFQSEVNNIAVPVISTLKGKLGQAPPKVLSYFQKKYPGEKFKLFFTDHKKAFKVDSNGIVSCKKYDQRLNDTCTLVELYHSSQFNKTFSMLYKTLLKIVLFVSEKKNASLDQLLSFVNKLEESACNMIKNFKGIGLSEKLVNFLLLFHRLFYVTSEKFFVTRATNMYLQLTLDIFLFGLTVTTPIEYSVIGDLLELSLLLDLPNKMHLRAFGISKLLSPSFSKSNFVLNEAFIELQDSDKAWLTNEPIQLLVKELKFKPNLVYSELASVLFECSATQDFMKTFSISVLLEALEYSTELVCAEGKVSLINWKPDESEVQESLKELLNKLLKLPGNMDSVEEIHVESLVSEHQTPESSAINTNMREINDKDCDTGASLFSNDTSESDSDLTLKGDSEICGISDTCAGFEEVISTSPRNIAQSTNYQNFSNHGHHLKPLEDNFGDFKSPVETVNSCSVDDASSTCQITDKEIFSNKKGDGDCISEDYHCSQLFGFLSDNRQNISVVNSVIYDRDMDGTLHDSTLLDFPSAYARFVCRNECCPLFENEDIDLNNTAGPEIYSLASLNDDSTKRDYDDVENSPKKNKQTPSCVPKVKDTNFASGLPMVPITDRQDFHSDASSFNHLPSTIPPTLKHRVQKEHAKKLFENKGSGDCPVNSAIIDHVIDHSNELPMISVTDKQDLHPSASSFVPLTSTITSTLKYCVKNELTEVLKDESCGDCPVKSAIFDHVIDHSDKSHNNSDKNCDVLSNAAEDFLEKTPPRTNYRILNFATSTPKAKSTPPVTESEFAGISYASKIYFKKKQDTPKSSQLPQNTNMTQCTSHLVCGKVILLTEDTCIIETKFNNMTKLVHCMKRNFSALTSTAFSSLAIGDMMECHLMPSSSINDSLWIAHYFYKI